MILAEKNIYHFDASLKDLGKKLVVSIAELWFAFSKMDKTAFALMENLKKVMGDE